MVVDVVIPAFRHWALTASCLTHLRAQAEQHHVILVDNGCDEGTAERAATSFPEVDVLRLEQPVTFARACNLGAARGDGEHVVLLNNDVDLAPGSLTALVAALERSPRTGSACAVLTAPDSTVDSAGLAVDRTLAAFPRQAGQDPATVPSCRLPLMGPAGAAAGYRRTAWEQVGGLDEAIRAYGEDLDLALRLQAVGWETTLALEARGVHLGSATFGHRSATQRRSGGFGRGYLLRRYGVLRGSAAPRALLTEAIVCVGDAVLSRDLEAIRGRLAGWRAARGMSRRPVPPARTVTHDLTLWASLQLRRGVYTSQEAS